MASYCRIWQQAVGKYSAVNICVKASSVLFQHEEYICKVMIVCGYMTAIMILSHI